MAIDYFATCARGLEPILAGELRQLGAADVTEDRGGVSFRGDDVLLYRANLWLRTAVRVLKPILKRRILAPEDLYNVVQTIDWSQHLTINHTLAVDCNVRDSYITHSLYAAQKTKDAICDQFLRKCGKRPSVDLENPMVKLNLHIYRNEGILSLDSSGESLHKRGYRPVLTKAPLNEALAASIVLHSGWNPETPFLDPMCGGAALPIEASWIALKRAPGLTRKRFGFQGWMDFDIALWSELREEARVQMLKKLPSTIRGSELRSDAVHMAQENANAAGVGHLVEFDRCDFIATAPRPGETGGTLICNPPYGERLGETKSLRPLYQEMGKVFADKFDGWNCWIFTGNKELAAEIKLPVTAEVRLWNGKIPCRLLCYRPGALPTPATNPAENPTPEPTEPTS